MDYAGMIGPTEISFLKRYLDVKIWNGIDVGCGGRKVLPQCIGIDTVRDEMTDLSCGVNTIAEFVCNGEVLPFKDQTLNYVLSRHVLEHLDWKKALIEWHRVLVNGGLLCIIVPDPKCTHHPGHGINRAEVTQFLALDLEMDQVDSIRVPWNEDDFYSWGLIFRRR